MVREKMVEYPPCGGVLRKVGELKKKEALELAEHYRKKAQAATEEAQWFVNLAENLPG